MAKYDAGVVLIPKRYDSPSPQRWNQKILWLNYYTANFWKIKFSLPAHEKETTIFEKLGT